MSSYSFIYTCHYSHGFVSVPEENKMKQKQNLLRPIRLQLQVIVVSETWSYCVYDARYACTSIHALNVNLVGGITGCINACALLWLTGLKTTTN